MRFSFTEVPDLPGGPRPALPVTIEALARAPQLGLLDTGSLHNRFGLWVARWCGIDLSSAPEERIALGGFATVARTVDVELAVGGWSWEAPVSFCDPWPLGFQILGQNGFFRWFRVTVRAAEYTIDLEPEDR